MAPRPIKPSVLKSAESAISCSGLGWAVLMFESEMGLATLTRGTCSGADIVRCRVVQRHFLPMHTRQASERGRSFGNTAWLRYMCPSMCEPASTKSLSCPALRTLVNEKRLQRESIASNRFQIRSTQSTLPKSTKMAQTQSNTSTATVSVHALSCGHFTLPEHQFVKPSTLSARRTVPSLAFLIQHTASSGETTRIVFDLGLRADLHRYPPPIQKHTENRRPIATKPDVVQNLARGGLAPDDIDYVVYSHVRDLPPCIVINPAAETEVIGALGPRRRPARLPLVNLRRRPRLICASGRHMCAVPRRALVLRARSATARTQRRALRSVARTPRMRGPRHGGKGKA